ncbi:MAG TPA: hypothetical protein VF458_05630 [Ktedonobacteraceae bacterium]
MLSVECEHCGASVVLEQTQESPTWLRHSYHCAVCGHTNADYPVKRLTLDLSVLSTAQLRRLAEEIHTLLEERQRAEAPCFSFAFRASGNERIGAIYVATLSWDAEERRLTRTFYDLPKRRNAGTTYVEATFTAKPGDVIEQQWPGSWAHPKQRIWLVVSSEGTLVKVASGERHVRDPLVLDYLRGTIDLAQLLKERRIG